MKHLFMFCIVVSCVAKLDAQNIGLGTTSPHPSALLDVKSTNKGVLIPRMSNFQRIGIPAPANGLLVYDTVYNELYHYEGSKWVSILNSTYWFRPTNRSRFGNTSDSVGIGTISPTNRLDVNGNIRTRNTLIADDNVVATWVVSAGALTSSGNLFVDGPSSLNGTVTASSGIITNGDIIVNNSGAILQLRNGSNDNRGFLQLNTDDIRLGTNVGNIFGRVILRLNGNNRVVISPTGDMDLDGNITRIAATGISPLLPVCYGTISSTGVIISGTNNFSVVKGSLGEYTINSTAIKGTSIVVATPFSKNRTVAAVAYSTYCYVNVFNPTSGDVDGSFNFIVY
jgi:hypothetical protein